MRFLILLLLALPAAGQDLANPIPYPIRDLVNDVDQIARVHKAVVLHLAEAHALMIKESAIEFEILQTVPGRGYLCSGGDRIVLIETKDTGYADGDKKEICVQGTGRTYEYTAITGAGKTVHILEALKLPDLPDAATFLKRLQAGEKFTIQKGTRTIRCENCGGFGKGRMVDGRYVRCSCGDVGTWSEPVFYQVEW